MGAEEFRPEYSLTKQKDIVKVLPSDIDTYGEVIEYDEVAPDEAYSFDGEGLSVSDAANLHLACLTRHGESVELIDEATGKNYIGDIDSVSTQRIGGSAKLTFKINMKKIS